MSDDDFRDPSDGEPLDRDAALDDDEYDEDEDDFSGDFSEDEQS
jgi:hypothetical protein